MRAGPRPEKYMTCRGLWQFPLSSSSCPFRKTTSFGTGYGIEAYGKLSGSSCREGGAGSRVLAPPRRPVSVPAHRGRAGVVAEGGPVDPLPAVGERGEGACHLERVHRFRAEPDREVLLERARDPEVLRGAHDRSRPDE